MASRRAICLALCLVASPGVAASAAPPVDGAPTNEAGARDCSCEDQLSVDECVLARAVELNGQGQEKFEAGDYAGAIEVWEEAIILLPESRRVRLAAPLAYAHARAYEVDGELDHLRAARELFTAHLDNLDASAQKVHEETTSELAAIEAEFARLEAERDREIRAEEAALREQALAKAGAANDRRIRRFHNTVGGTLVGVGGVSMVMMTAGLAYGQSRDRIGAQYATDRNVPQSQYDTLLGQGIFANVAAWTTGVIGGALLVSGATLIIVGARKAERSRGEGRDRAQARRLVQPQGLGFRF